MLSGAAGATVTTVDGRTLTDYVLGMGPMLLGHGRQEVLDRVAAQLPGGVLFGTTRVELELAERLAGILPHAERIAYVNSGSEGTHLAIRIARASTGRRIIVKFEGHYHGWIDPLFVNTQSNTPDRSGSPTVAPMHGVADQTVSSEVIVLRWNDRAALEQLFADRGAEIAAVILEPVPLNFGTVLPEPGYTELLRDLSSRAGAMLIFDEVLSGFRIALGGAAQLLGVKPDIAVYAKAIASGFPLAVVAGTEAAMASIVSGPVLPAGTYSGNPVAVSAALATLDVLEGGGDDLYAGLDRLGHRLAAGIRDAASAAEVPLLVQQVGSVLQLLWGDLGVVRSYADAARSDRATIAALCEQQIGKGAMVAPRGLILLSTAHSASDVDRLVEGVTASLQERTR